MAVSGVSNITTYQPTEAELSKNVSSSSGYDLTMNDFYKLLAAELQYQDPDNPMDTNQMVSSLLDSQMIQSLTTVTDAVTQLQNSSATQYAISLQGKEITVAEMDSNGRVTGEYTTGTVDGVILGSEPLLVIGGNQYTLTQAVSVGEVSGNADTATNSGE